MHRNSPRKCLLRCVIFVLLLDRNLNLAYPEGVLDSYKYLPSGVAWLASMTTKYFMLGAEEGAYTSLFAAASSAVGEKRDEYRATYLVPYDKITIPSPLARDPELGQALWKTTEQILHDVYKIQ